MYDSVFHSKFFLFLLCFLFSIQSILTFSCYECKDCADIPSCKCTNIFKTNRTDVHCILLRQTLSNGMIIEIEHRPATFSKYHIYDAHYISVEEAIIYNNNTATWSSISNKITYGCPTELCNRYDLLEKLPSNGLSLMLPSDWLNENLQRKTQGDLALCRKCDEGVICGNSPATMNASACPREDCHGSCFTDETYENAETTQFCYDSLCTDETAIGPNGRLPQVNITAFYYLNKDQFEVVEIDVICNADRCDTFDLFTNIKKNLQKDLNNIKPFLSKSNYSIYSISIVFIIMILFIQVSILY